MKVGRTLPALALALLLAAPAAAQDVFRRANGNEPDTLDPQKYELASEGVILRDMFEGLTTTDADNRVVPGQAESWTVSEDGLIWTFRLREGLVWSDGAPLTAEDFVAGMQRVVDPATAAKIPDMSYKILHAREILDGKMEPAALGVSAPDARTVVVKVTARSPLIPLIIGHSVLGPVPRHVLAQYGDDWVKAEHIVTNGAYTLAKWEPATEVRLVKNPHYRDAAAVTIPQIAFFPSDDQEMALKRFRAGELDLVNNIPATKIAWAKTEVPDALALMPVNQVRYLELNHRLEKLTDVRVRRALAMAIDRETIADRLSGGSVLAAWGYIPRSIEGYDGASFNFAGQSQAERITAAKALLAEAGYGPGNPLTIELRVMSDSWAKPLAAAIVAMWGQAGVKAQVLSAEAKVHFAAISQGQFEIAVSGWFGSEDPETFMWLFLAEGGMNKSEYLNPAFDAAATEAETTMDIPTRFARYAAAEQMLLDDVAMIPVFWTVQASLISPAIQGFKPTPRGLPRSRWASFGR
jgi:oligopeptide transport system substrate-binding protein